MKTFRAPVAWAAMMLLGCAALPSAARAQQDGLPTLDELKPSPTPAFILLGVSPSDVERPRTPADVGFSVLNSTQYLSKLPDNYAAETAPYWLFGHPTLQWRDDTTRSVGASVARTFLLSIATAEVGTQDSAVTGLAVGASTYLLSGRLSDSTQARFRAIEQALVARSNLQNQLRLSQVRALNAELGPKIAAAPNPQARDSLLNELTLRSRAINEQVMQDPRYLEALQQDRYKLANAEPQREGMFWGLAGGVAWRYPDRVWNRGQVSQVGVWSTLSYEGQRMGKMGFTPVAVVRYLAQRGDTVSDVVDAGTRLVFSGDAYDLSVEGLIRMGVSSGTTQNLWRFAGVFDYRLAPTTWATVSFGRDYHSSRQGSLIAQLGVKVDFTHDRYAPPAAPGPPPPASP